MDNSNEDLLIDNDLFEEFKEEVYYDCYNCNWCGKDPFEQKSDIWEAAIILICPECGGLLSD